MPIRSPGASWQRFRGSPPNRSLLALVRHFFLKMFRLGGAGDEQGDAGIGVLLGLLATPGAFLCIFLLDKYSSLLHYFRGIRKFDPLEASLPDRYFLIVFSMAITGIVTTLKWQSILPDRQDFLNLAPLPVRSRTILLANSIAVLMVAAVFAIDINAASAVLFPIIVTGAETSLPLGIRFSLTHFVCVLLAAGFAFSAVFAALGLLLAILPGRVFRFASIWARGAAITGLLALALTSGIAHLPPAVWFLGLSEVLLGRGDARSHALMNTGLLACAMSFIAAAVVYALCYRRSFLQAADIGTQLDTRPGGKWLSRLWARVPVGGSFERAGYSFMMRTLLRSDPHCLCVGAFAGMGLLFASQAALSSPLPAPGELPGAPWLSLPLIVSYMLLIGVRVAFEMPAGLQSNWIFQSVLAGTGHKAAAIARAGLLTCLAPLVLLPTFLGYSVFWGVMLASLHTAYVLTLSLGLIEVLLLRFRKIPFTCALPPFQNNLIMLCFLAAIGFTLFAGPAAQMAHWMLQNSVRFAILPVVVLALRLAGRYRPSELHPEASSLVFDPLPEPTVEHLRLLDR